MTSGGCDHRHRNADWYFVLSREKVTLGKTATMSDRQIQASLVLLDRSNVPRKSLLLGISRIWRGSAGNGCLQSFLERGERARSTWEGRREVAQGHGIGKIVGFSGGRDHPMQPRPQVGGIKAPSCQPPASATLGNGETHGLPTGMNGLSLGNREQESPKLESP